MKQYHDLVKLVMNEGVRKSSRTGVDTISYFGAFYRVDLSEGFPLLTTKK
ncbi:MAG: thymidylate synthase, partial [Ignavibacterium sp.]|nr:thymidylate synthase [Ignavibacterium sp.]